MQSFTLSAPKGSFRMLKSPCCNSVDCDCKKAKGDNFTKIFNGLLAVTYILSAGMIIYSLLLFNLVWAQGLASNSMAAVLQKPAVATSQLQVPVLAYLPNISEVWLQTAIFAEATGYFINNSIDTIIQGASNGLIALFITTGNILSRVPDILTASPVLAQVPGS